MYKFKLNVQNVAQIPSNGNSKTYLSVVSLKSLINAHQTIGKDLYSVNVRGTLFTGKSPDRKNDTYSGIEKTLIGIHNSTLEPIEFFNNNNGCLLICDSFSKVDENSYEVILQNDYHGIGNGQQTISIANFINNKYQIPEDVYVRVTVMEGYNESSSHIACRAHNTANKITKKDIVSNDWKPLSEELENMGYVLHYKADAVPPIGENVINIYERGFYNLLNAYHTEMPWKTGNKIIDVLDIKSIDKSTMITVFDLKRVMDKWFDMNIKNYDDSKFDSSRTIYIKDVIMTAIKRYYKTSKPINKFIKICWEEIFYVLNSREKRANSDYFQSQDNCERLLDRIQLRLMKENSLLFA